MSNNEFYLLSIFIKYEGIRIYAKTHFICRMWIYSLDCFFLYKNSEILKKKKKKLNCTHILQGFVLFIQFSHNLSQSFLGLIELILNCLDFLLKGTCFFFSLLMKNKIAGKIVSFI